MSEQAFPIKLLGREYEATRYNTSLYQFIGTKLVDGAPVDLSSRDHVFCDTKVWKIPNQAGIFVFKGQEGFDLLRTIVVENDFPQHLNLADITKGDEAVYQRYITQLAESGTADVDAGVPESWR